MATNSWINLVRQEAKRRPYRRLTLQFSLAALMLLTLFVGIESRRLRAFFRELERSEPAIVTTAPVKPATRPKTEARTPRRRSKTPAIAPITLSDEPTSAYLDEHGEFRDGQRQR